MELEFHSSCQPTVGSRPAAGRAAAGLALLLASGAVDAACVSPAPGPSLSAGQLSLTCQTSNSAAPAQTSTNLISLLSIPGTYFYGNSYPSTSPLAGDPDGFGFYDDYVFTIGAASANSITSTIDLGVLQVSNLDVRLYGLTGNPIPTFGVPSGPLYSNVSVPVLLPGASGSYVVIPEVVLGAGTYVLEVRGNATGSAGGSYSGTLNLTPVPLPGAAWLLGSALLGFVSLVRRRT